MPNLPPPRWRIEITPTPNGQDAQIGLMATADGVVCAEVAFVLTKALGALIARGTERVPTVAEVQAEAKRQVLTTTHPAVRIFTRKNWTLCLGTDAVHRYGAQLVEAGWTNACEVPASVRVPCAFQEEPELLDVALAQPEPPPSELL